MKGSEVKTKIGNPTPYVENAPTTVNGGVVAPASAPTKSNPPATYNNPPTAVQPKPQFNNINRVAGNSGLLFFYY